MSIKLTIGECESAAGKYHAVAREVGNQKASLTGVSGGVKGAWEGGAADEWANRIDIVANQVEQGLSDDISSVGDLLDDIAKDARALRGKAEALPASLGGSGDSGGARLVLDDGAAGGVRGDVTALGDALDKVGPVIADVRGILSQLKTCSLSVDDAAEAAVKDAKGKLETFSGDWDAYLSGVSSLVDKITSGMAKLDPNEPAMRENATAKAVANYGPARPRQQQLRLRRRPRQHGHGQLHLPGARPQVGWDAGRLGGEDVQLGLPRGGPLRPRLVEHARRVPGVRRRPRHPPEP